MGEWKLVPVEPTEEMVEDGELTLSRVLIGFDYVMPSDGLSRVYHAMLAASPAPSLPEDVERVVKMLESADPYEIFGNDGKTAAALIQSLSSQLAARDRLAADNERLREICRMLRDSYEPRTGTYALGELHQARESARAALASLEERT